MRAVVSGSSISLFIYTVQTFSEFCIQIWAVRIWKYISQTIFLITTECGNWKCTVFWHHLEQTFNSCFLLEEALYCKLAVEYSFVVWSEWKMKMLCVTVQIFNFPSCVTDIIEIWVNLNLGIQAVIICFYHVSQKWSIVRTNWYLTWNVGLCKIYNFFWNFYFVKAYW
jgi:hypothetical protein